MVKIVTYNFRGCVYITKIVSLVKFAQSLFAKTWIPAKIFHL